jgi:hypothetical protein
MFKFEIEDEKGGTWGGDENFSFIFWVVGIGFKKFLIKNF